MTRLKTYFTITGVLALIGLILAIAGFVLGLGAAFMGVGGLEQLQ